MPEDGLIEKDGNPLAQIAWVSALQTSGSLVLGKYDYTDFPKTADESNRNFFLLDTSTGRKQDFATESDLSNVFNGPIHLTPTEFFHAPKPPSRRVRDFSLFLIAFMPPTTAGLWLFLASSKPSPHSKNKSGAVGPRIGTAVSDRMIVAKPS
jgi:hypothetical protein